MADEDVQIETFTGTITQIGRRSGNSPRLVKMDDGGGGQYEKSLRVWEYEYNEDEDADKEVSELFEKLETFAQAETEITVEIKVREYKVKGQKRKQNLIIDAWPADEEREDSEEPKKKDPADDWGKPQSETKAETGAKPQTKEKTTTAKPNAGRISPADIERIADRVIEKFREAGGAVMGKPAEEMTPDPDVDKEMRASFLEAAKADEIGPKAIQKNFDRLFPETGDWSEVSTAEQLTALADTLGIEWE